jgi:hypothetical protein
VSYANANGGPRGQVRLAQRATGHSFGVDMIRIATRMQYGVLMVYVFALVMGVWSAVLGVQLAIDSSVPGGLAVILAGAILIALAGLRITVKWKQLRGQL